jgi:hypothetical protein
MPMREVVKYQQTFHGTTDDDEFTFSFYRVYKQNQKNKFRVRVVQLVDYRDSKVDNIPHAYFASGLANGTSTYSDEISQGSTGMRSNEFCLGSVMPVYFGGTAQVHTSGQTQFLAPEFVVDDLSTSPFTIRYRQIGIDAIASSAIAILICFEITEIEEVAY